MGLITLKRIPTEPETYEVWLIPESVGFDSSFGVRGAVRAEAEDLRAIVPDPCAEAREGRLRAAFDAAAADLVRLRVVVDETHAALDSAGMAEHGTLAERVVRLRNERESLRAELRRAEGERERFLAMLRPASSSWNQR